MGYIAYRVIKGFLAKRESVVNPLKYTETFQDPVCGVYVSPEDATVGRLEGRESTSAPTTVCKNIRTNCKANNALNTEEV